MSAPHAEQLVDEYLGRLDAALAGEPPDRREEIVGEIRSHIAEERSHLSDETDADLHNLLERLGDPTELAQAARPATASKEGGVAPSSFGPVEVLALVLTPIIWPVGVILYWLSPRWNTRDKLIATLIPPGGYPVLLIALQIMFLSTTASGGCMTETDAQGNVISHQCTGVDAWPDWERFAAGAAAIAVLVIVLLLPVLVGIYMTRRLRLKRIEAPA